MTDRRGSNEMLRSIAAELEMIHVEIVALLDRTDNGWRRELIALRRRLQQQVQMLPPIFDTLELSPIDIHRLRDAFNRMRSRIALLQAAWPAVAIERDDPNYQASVREVGAVNREFFQLVKVLLARA